MKFSIQLTLFICICVCPYQLSFAQSSQRFDLAQVSEGKLQDDTLTEETIKATTLSDKKLPAKKARVKQEKKQGVAPKIVRTIDIKGNKSIGISTILAKIKTRVGQPYLQNVISDDLKRLYNTGFFSDVSVDREDYKDGFRVIIFLIEKPIIQKITFSRTKQIKSRSILNKLVTREGKFLDKRLLKDDISTIKELYSKKGLTMVEVEVETTLDEDANKATLHFIIKEGTRIKIKKINVYGNKAYRESKIMRLIKTRADSLFTSGYLREEILEEDLERIKAFYEQEGYIDANITREFEYFESGKLIINIKITEGKKYFIEDVTLAGNKVLTDEEIKAVMTEAIVGNPFSRGRLTVDLSNIRTLYFDKGYIFANVRETTSLNSETGKVNVQLDILEGKLAYINRIKIEGNMRTRDIVVRRELRLYPGDRFDGAKLRRSKERLRNLGYFEEVNYDVQETDNSDLKDLVVQVKEAKTGTLSFGGGYSSVDQIVGFVEVEQKNFDFASWPTFTGGGQNLVLRAETGSTRNNMRLSFTEPWLFDYPISGGFDVYLTERDKDEDVGYAYDEKRMGGGIRFGKQFTEYISGGVSFKREDITIDNLDTNVSADLKAEEGDSTLSVMGFTVARDSRDSVFSPTRGLIVSGGSDIAGGFLGGTKDFYRFEGRASYYFPLKYNAVLELRLRAGVVDAYGDSDKVPIYERFFAGGASTIRGYEERKVGPIDSVTDDPLGGEALLVANIEYVIPLIDFIKLAAFFDVGNVWGEIEDFASGDYKAGAGLGLRVKTPIGPVKLDYGFPLNDEPGEEDQSGKFYFSISRGF